MTFQYFYNKTKFVKNYGDRLGSITVTHTFTITIHLTNYYVLRKCLDYGYRRMITALNEKCSFNCKETFSDKTKQDRQ